MLRCGYAATSGDAPEDLKSLVDYVSEAASGQQALKDILNNFIAFKAS